MHALQPLERHAELSHTDFIVREDAQVRRQPEERACHDEPFGGVVLVPFHGVSIVHGKLVMEIVVPLAKGQDGGEEVITRGVLVIVCRLSQVVRD